MIRQSLRAILLLPALVAGVVPAIGQPPPSQQPPSQPPPPLSQPPAIQPPASDPQSPYRPPAMRFDAAGLTLLEAVRLTLQHDPNIKLRETDTEFQRGVLRTEKGLFDPVLAVNGNFARNQSQLLDSQKQDEQQRRDDLAAAIREVDTLTQSLTAAGALLRDRNAALNNPSSWNLSTIRDPDVLNQMTILQSQLVLFRDILASPQLTDQTVRNDIVNLREVTLGRNIDNFNAQQTTIADAPGQLRTQLANLGDTPSEQWTKQGSLLIDVNKLFRNGISLHPFVDLRYNSQNFVGKDLTDVDFGGQGIEPVSNGRIGFDVDLPLLRNRGRSAVAAGEIAAGFDLEASRLQLLFQQSESVLTTVQAYWQARAAADQVEVLRRSVEIQGELSTATRSMIAANEKPRSDEARVLASTADARSRYEAAQRQLNDARIALAQSMGVALADALSIPLAADPYPQPPPDIQFDPQLYAAFIRDAIVKRFDRQAALRAESSGKALVTGARLDTKPLLDVVASGFGTSVHQGGIGYGQWVFRSGSLGLNFEKPFGNNTARGLLDERLASLHRTEIDSANIERLIGVNIIQLAEQLKVAADRLKSAEEAVRNYDLTIATEQTRFRSGDASLLDTILTEQQTTTARLSYITARQEYASILAALRHEAGVLVGDGTVDALQLIAVPRPLVR